MNVYEQNFIVEYIDVDHSGMLSNWGFFKVLQEIGCLHADELGFGFTNSSKTGLAWVLLDWKLQIFKRPHWKDEILVRTWPSRIHSIRCNRDYEIFDKSGNRLAIATSEWVLFNLNKRSVSKLTPEVTASFTPVPNFVFDTPIEKLLEPESVDSSFEYTVLKRDIDSNEHMNNLNYILLANEFLPNTSSFSRIDVMYKKQCLVGNKIMCLYKKVSEDEHVVTIKSEDLKELHAIIKFRS